MANIYSPGTEVLRFNMQNNVCCWKISNHKNDGLHSLSKKIQSLLGKAFFAAVWLLLITVTSFCQTLSLSQTAFIENGFGNTPNLNKCANVFVTANYAYVVGENYLQILDITLPGNPTHKGILYSNTGGALFNFAERLYVSGNHAYIMKPNGEIQVVDVSDPANPKHKSLFGLSISGSGIFVLGNYAYAVNGNSSTPFGVIPGNLRTTDVTNPAEPKQTASTSIGDLRGITGATIKGSTYLFTITTTALGIYNITSTPSQPTFVTSFTHASLTNLNDITVAGDNVFISSNDGKVIKVNVANPSNPAWKATLNSANSKSVRTRGAHVYIRGALGTLQVADTASLTNVVGTLSDPSMSLGTYGAETSFGIMGNSAFIPGYQSGTFTVVDISNPAALTIRKSLTSNTNGTNMSAPRKMVVSGNYAFVAGYLGQTLQVLDVSNANSPRPLSTIPISDPDAPVGTGGPRSLFVLGNYAYLGTASTIEIVDISSPNFPVWVSRAKNGVGGIQLNDVRDIAAISIGGKVFVMAASLNTNSVEIVEVTTPTSPVYKQRLSNGGGAASPFLSGPVNLSVFGTNLYVLSRAHTVTLTAAGTITATSGSNLITGFSTSFTTCGLAPGSLLYYTIGQFSYYLGTVQTITSNTSLTLRSNAINVGTGSWNFYHAHPSFGRLQIFDLSNLATGNADTKGSLAGVGSDLPGRPGIAADPVLNTVNVGTNRITIAQKGSTTYAYIADTYHSSMAVVNVTDTNAPTLAFSTGPKEYLVGSKGIALFDKYALITYHNTEGLQQSNQIGIDAWNIENPLTPVHVPNALNPTIGNITNGTLLDGNNNAILNSPYSIALKGTTALVGVHNQSDGITVLDMYWPRIEAATAGFSPASGPVGTSVTINGQNFDTSLSASIAGLPAPITQLAETSVTITIPPNAEIGKITLSNSSREVARSTVNFLVIPTSNPATAVTQNSFMASWSDVGATTYFLDVSTSNAFTNFVTGYQNRAVGNVNSFNVSGLAPGTNYFWRVRSTDGASFNTISTGAASSFTASWSNVGASSYFLDVSTQSNFSTFVTGYNNRNVGNVSSFVVSGLSAGATYYWRLRDNTGTNITSVSGNSNPVNTITIPTTPIATAASAFTQSGFNVNWNAVGGIVTNYFLDVATDNGFTNFVPGYNNLSVAGTTQVVSGLNSGTYYARARSANASGSSPNSNTVTIATIPPNPVASPASSIGSASFNANWSIVAGVTNYFLDVSSDNFATFVINNLNVAGNSTTASITGLSSGVTYQYRVRASNASGTSGNSNIVSTITIPSAPSVQSASSITTSSFTVNWTLAVGATSYTVEWATNDLFTSGYSSSPALGNVSSYNITGLTNGTAYFYRVTATNTNGSSSPSNPTRTQRTLSLQPITQSTSILFTTISNTQLTVNCTAPANGGGNARLIVVSANAPLNTLPVNQTSYSANPIFGSANTALGNGFVVSNSSNTQVTVTNLQPGTTYFFQVFDFNGANGTENYLTSAATGNPASQVTLSTPPGNQPTNLTFSNITSSSLSASFTAPSLSPAGYLVLRSSASGNPTPPTNGVSYSAGSTIGSNTVVYVGSATSFNESGLAAGNTYYYTIYSYNGTGSTLNYLVITPLQNAVTLTPPAPVAGTATSVTDSGFTANWASANGATNYFLDVSSDNFITFLTGYNSRSVTGTNASVSNLSSGTSYQYRVRANISTGSLVSAYSNTTFLITRPAAPVAQAASSITNSSFTANWALTTGASSYLLEWATNTAFTSGYGSYSTPSGNISSYNITGLPTATPYFYRITASNQSGISNFSSVISLKTLADPANVQSSNLTFSNISSSSITINFSVGNGSSRIVVASAGSPLLTALPSNQTSYTANSAFGSGSAIGNGFVVSNGNVSSVTVTNLALASIYFFQVFEYNGTSGTENYLTTSAANNPASQATLASTSALTQPTNLIFSNITGTTLIGSFTTASGNPTGYLVIRSTAASIPTAPVNGTNYTTGSNYGSDRVAYAGPSASFSDSGLGNGITYYYTIYSFSGSGSTTNYLTSNPLQNSVTTIPPAPVIANASAIASNGFTANWSATTGAVDYLLDLSTDNFATLVPGYSSLLVGSVTSYQAAGLIAGTSYRYRVRARNNSGISVSSNSTAVTTLPSPPTGLSISNVADNSFSLTWSKSLGATGYLIDVSPNSSFTTLTYNNINAGDVSSFSIGGLAAGSTYYVRVRSSNTTGPSSNSSSVSATTYAVFPSQQSGSISFSNVNSTSITANFTVGNGSSRLMVVSFGAPLTATPVNGFSYSADTKFGSGTPIGNGFVVSTGAGPVTVTNLQSTSLYYFQVFEFNGSGGTENYNKQTVTGNPLSQSTISFTPLEQPTNLLFSGQTSSSVNVSFTPAVNNPSGYLVLRTTNAAPSVAPVNGTAYTIGTPLGNSVVASVGPSVSFFDGGLPTEKTYTYTVYAYNGVGSTSSYLVVNPLQANVILDTTPPVISFPISNPTSITEGNTPLFNATVIDNVSVKSVTFFYRGISQVNFKSVAMNSGTSNNYSVQIQSDWYDSLGLEYYVQAIDQNNNTSARGTSFFARLIKPSITLPSLPTGTGLADYRIVSFPYLLPVNNDVTTVYSNVPWNDNTKAGLWWWNPSTNNGLGGYDQYGKSPTLKTIDPGKGYWVITSSPVTPQLTNVPAPNYNKDKLYQMNLKPGWNQIGNPYPISVSWDEVIAFNEARGSAAFGKLNIYDGQTIKEATGNTLLKAFQGGFVKNLTSSDITLQIPMPGQAKGGRKATAENSDITQDDWRLFLHIQQGGIKNELGGFGMHPKATMGEDPFDNFNIPAFVNAPEVQFSRTETSKSIFSSDVVKTQAHFVWTFKPKGVGAHKARLSWNEQIITGDQQLFLLDEENLNIVDMSQVSYYDFNLSATSSFKIYYGKDAIHSITSEKIQISEPHPNPVSTDNLVTFKMALPQTVDPYSVQIQVFNLQGITIYKSEKKFAGGLRQLELELHSDLPAGTYLYQVVVSSPNLQESRTGKLIKK